MPTMRPPSRATNSVVAGSATMRSSRARSGGGEEVESWGTSAVTAAAELVVDRPGGLDGDHDVAESPRHIGWRTLS